MSGNKEHPKSIYLRGKSPDPRHHVPIAVPVRTLLGSHGGCPDGGRFTAADIAAMEREYLNRGNHENHR